MLFMMTVHPYQAYPNCKHIRMTCRACIQLLLGVDEIDDRIDNQIIKKKHILLVHLAALDNGRKLDIGTIKKDRVTYFQNISQKYLRKFFYVMSMKYYLKWLKHP